MDIVLKVFEELNFVSVDEFVVEHNINDNSIIQVAVNVLISNENDSQVFLLINCDNKQLHYIVEGDLVKAIALQFRRKKYHRAEMDRNTSLYIISKHEVDENVDASSKVKIEDDPFYFKKYVFSYDEVGLENANSLLVKNGSKNTVVALIQEYITDTDRFAMYKNNCINEPIYSYFIELVTKIHCFPMKTVETKDIYSINDFLRQEIERMKDRKKNPVNIDEEKITEFIKQNIDYSDAEEVCNCWNGIIRTESGARNDYY